MGRGTIQLRPQGFVTFFYILAPPFPAVQLPVSIQGLLSGALIDWIFSGFSHKALFQIQRLEGVAWIQSAAGILVTKRWRLTK